jgi:hypothetical protein
LFVQGINRGRFSQQLHEEEGNVAIADSVKHILNVIECFHDFSAHGMQPEYCLDIGKRASFSLTRSIEVKLPEMFEMDIWSIKRSIF